MIKILFVCHGNICRSPMAEFIMKDLVSKKRLDSKFEIASCATSTEAIGCSVYYYAKQKLLENNINCDGKTARQMTKGDYNYYDYIVAMDNNNLRNMKAFVGDDPQGKVSLMMDYTERGGDVADPWYTRDFETTWRDISQGCDGLLNHILNKEK